MDAVLLTIGDELLSGDTVDTNSAFLARGLGELGVRTVARYSVPDVAVSISRALRRALEETGLVITTGGLGPTRDDITLETVATELGLGLEIDPEQARRVREVFRRRGLAMPRLNENQFRRVKGGRIIYNPAGTAPAQLIDVPAGTVVLLPGVPREVVELWNGGVAEALAESYTLRRQRRLTLRTIGVSESSLAERIEPVLTPRRLTRARVKLAYLPGHGLVDLRLTALGETPETDAAAADFDELVLELADIVGSCAYGREKQTLSEVVGERLAELGLTVGVAESCTGGKLGKWLTDQPGSSRYFVGGVTAYANAVKEALLAVPAEILAMFGAVSRPVAAAMARGALTALSCDCALSTTGIAGPAGGTPEKPVGTVYLGLAFSANALQALGWDAEPPATLAELDGLERENPAINGAVFTRLLRLTGDRDLVRLRSVLHALDTLRRALG